MEPMLYRVRDFCAAHAISPVTFYKLLAQGQGPRITRIGGGTFISADDAAAWRRKMAEATDQAQLRPRPRRAGRSWITDTSKSESAIDGSRTR
jgi:hypothetical protein